MENLELWSRLLESEVRYDACNPDVGMGPSPEMLLNKVEQRVGTQLDPYDKQLILARFNQLRR
jgi:hypothetical protein